MNRPAAPAALRTGPAADATADALAGLLAVIAADRAARCRDILAPAEAAAAARLAEALRATRTELRQALKNERRRLQAQLDAARAELDAARRRRDQRLAQAVVDAGWALLVPALVRCWQEPACRRRWIAAALAAARARLPPADWRIRHPPGLAPAEAAMLLAELAAAGVAGAQCEAAVDLAAGLEIRAGDACLDASAAGLLADRAAVAGRLLYWWERA
jgi:hypothetical protein